MKISPKLNTTIPFLFLFISISCLLIVFISSFKLPQTSTRLISTTKPYKTTNNTRIGKFGEMIIDMLPNDLAFTVFIPSEEAFKRDLKLKVNHSFSNSTNDDDTYAILSRILGFSAVPRSIYSSTLDFGRVIDFDSLSGFRLFVGKEMSGKLVVNGVRSKIIDLKTGEIVVHVMDGVIMDADFEQSI